MDLEDLKKSVLVLDIETSAQWSDGKPVDIKTNLDEYITYTLLLIIKLIL